MVSAGGDDDLAGFDVVGEGNDTVTANALAARSRLRAGSAAVVR